MLELTVQAVEGDTFTAELDPEHGMAFSHDVRVVDLLLGACFQDRLDTDMQRLMLDVMGAIAIAPEDIDFRPDDPMQKRIEALYDVDGLNFTPYVYVAAKNASPIAGWEDAEYDLDEDTIKEFQHIHTDGIFEEQDIHFVRSDVSTVFVPDKRIATILHERSLLESEALRWKNRTVAEREATAEQLAHNRALFDSAFIEDAPYYWCTAKPFNLSAWRSTDTPHAVPQFTPPRRKIFGTDVGQNAIGHRLPQIVAARESETNTLKPLALAREHRPSMP